MGGRRRKVERVGKERHVENKSEGCKTGWVTDTWNDPLQVIGDKLGHDGKRLG